MEKDSSIERNPVSHDRSDITPEEVALQSLVNKLFANSDAAVCRIFSKFIGDNNEREEQE